MDGQERPGKKQSALSVAQIIGALELLRGAQRGGMLNELLLSLCQEVQALQRQSDEQIRWLKLLTARTKGYNVDGCNGVDGCNDHDFIKLVRRTFCRDIVNFDWHERPRDPTTAESDATDTFLGVSELRVEDVAALVAGYQPDARIRSESGLDVEVLGFVAPPGGPEIVSCLDELLRKINARSITPFQAHREYFALHPFTDANKRSGRAIWYWMMGAAAPLGFLHHWYLQSLEEHAAQLAQRPQ